MSAQNTPKILVSNPACLFRPKWPHANTFDRNQGGRNPYFRFIPQEPGEGFRAHGHTTRNLLPSLLRHLPDSRWLGIQRRARLPGRGYGPMPCQIPVNNGDRGGGSHHCFCFFFSASDLQMIPLDYDTLFSLISLRVYFVQFQAPAKVQNLNLFLSWYEAITGIRSFIQSQFFTF